MQAARWPSAISRISGILAEHSAIASEQTGSSGQPGVSGGVPIGRGFRR
jgi:hypothetical protein